jgi:hypothetical protein
MRRRFFKGVIAILTQHAFHRARVAALAALAALVFFRDVRAEVPDALAKPLLPAPRTFVCYTGSFTGRTMDIADWTKPRTEERQTLTADDFAIRLQAYAASAPKFACPSKLADFKAGAWEMNWLAYNVAHDITLPGSKGPLLEFLMYPQAETAAGRLDCLDPDALTYKITAKEVTA